MPPEGATLVYHGSIQGALQGPKRWNRRLFSFNCMMDSMVLNFGKLLTLSFPGWPSCCRTPGSAEPGAAHDTVA
jgi:hypothetical protein